MSEYSSKIIDIIQRIELEEKEQLDKVSKLVCDVIVNDGLIHVFGCGHSHLPGLDAFYRAGGLANVSVMLDSDLMLHDGAAKSSRMEKMSGIASNVFERYNVSSNDIIFILSASGKNLVPIELADKARENSIKSIGISSSNYFNKDGRLHKHVDIHIDCKVPYGDACIDIGGIMMGGLSTATACFILNTCLINGAKLAKQQGANVPVYLSGNVEGGRAHNEVLERKYLGRIKNL